MSEPREILARHGLDPATPIVAASPGAPRPAERWAPERFAEVLCALRHRHGWSVVLVGGDRERDVCEAVRRAVGGECANLAGETGPRELTALLRMCRLLVSNGAAALDLAIAEGTPAVGIFGPRIAPADGAGLRAVSYPVECRPCGRTRCGHHTCMRLLTVGAVLSRCESALRRR